MGKPRIPARLDVFSNDELAEELVRRLADAIVDNYRSGTEEMTRVVDKIRIESSLNATGRIAGRQKETGRAPVDTRPRPRPVDPYTEEKKS